MSTTPRLAVHGGAWNIPDAMWPDHRSGVSKAHASGMKVLLAGGPALDAIATAIRVMEDDPIFDAGIGSFLNEDGAVELDAGLMEGRDLKSGAVLGVAGIRNPIDLAVHILHHSDHCLFTGQGAVRLAKAADIACVPEDFHVLPREKAISEKISEGAGEYLDEAWVKSGHDTVGAIALDSHGNLAAGNSTGGIRHKAVGRVGDAALIGAGFYADNERGAVVCTGWGESIMRSGLAMTALHLLESMPPQAAADRAIAHLNHRVNGFGGLLLMAADGTCGVSFNTERMAYQLPAKP